MLQPKKVKHRKQQRGRMRGKSKGGKGVWNFGEIGTGDVDFASVLRILQDAGYDGPYSVEIEFSGEPWPPLAEVNAAMRGSREHLNGLGLE